MKSFKRLDYVPTGAECGCVMFRQYKTVKGLNADEHGMYACSVCQKKGGQNRHEVEMLEQLRSRLTARKESFILCCQFPLLSGNVDETGGETVGETANEVTGNEVSGKGNVVSKKKKNTVLKCDVVLVPCDAKHVSDLIAVELDSTDHSYNPRQIVAGVKRDRDTAHSETQDSDNRKTSTVGKAGMRLLRVQRDGIDAGLSRLSTILDSIQVHTM